MRNRRCCCLGAGIQRLSDSIFVNLADDTVFNDPITCMKLGRWPCWASPFDPFGTFDGCGVLPGLRVNDPFPLSGADLLGYNSGNDWAILETYYGYYQNYDLDHADSPAIVAAVMQACNDGIEPTVTLMTAAASYAAQVASLQGDSPSDINHSAPFFLLWIGASQDRIFGMSRYKLVSEGDETTRGHFKIWSTAYDGSDWQLVFDVHNVDPDTDPTLPVSANICDGVAFHVNATDDGVAIYENGGLIATMTGSGSANGSAAAVPSSDQILICCGPVLTSSPIGPNLLIVEDGADFDDQRIRFVYLDDDEEEVELSPLAISFDHKRQAVVVTWGFYFAFGSGPIVLYTTYIKNELSPGNILEQDITLIANYPAYGNGWELSPGPDVIQGMNFLWGIVIEGKLPRPTTVTALHIEPPEPALPTPDCGDFLDCPSETQAFYKQYGDGLLAHDDIVGDTTSFDGETIVFETRHWQDVSFNKVLHDVAFLPGGVIPDDGGRPAAGLDGGDGTFKRYWAPFGTFGSFSDPGFMAYEDDFDDTTVHRRGFICGIVVEVYCGDGQGVIIARYERQLFEGRVGATDPDLEWDSGLPPFETGLGTPLGQTGVEDILTYGIPTACAMTGILDHWEFRAITDDTAAGSSLSATTYCTVGPLL